MKIELVKVSMHQKMVLRHLLELYQYDFSEFDYADVNEYGLYDYKFLDHYWTEPDRIPFFIKVDERYAGFVLLRKLKNRHRVLLNGRVFYHEKISYAWDR